MPAPFLVVAGQVVRKVVLRRLLRLAVAALPVLLIGGLAVGLVVVLVVVSGGDQATIGPATGACTTLLAGSSGATPAGSSTPSGGLSAEQLANAQTIVAVGRQFHVPAYGWVVAVATALQESGLVNLPRGHLDSLGLFQQRAAWGPTADRLNPQTAARMFYEGGGAGQKGLTQIPGFTTMPLTMAAQAVQHSAFPDAYARWQAIAQQIVANPVVLSATCYTDAAYQGNGTAGANAVVAALQEVGTPYAWGGGGIGGPSTGFGPGGATVGFDCSSLVQYAYHQATGLSLPRTTDAQAAALSHVPAGAPLQAGDLLFFHAPGDPPGSYHHVGIYDGQGGMIHAPHTGATVEVVHNVMQDPYFASQLAVIARPAIARAVVQAASSR